MGKEPSIKEKGRKPTLKQERAVKLIVEKGRSVSAAMREVGYSANTARDPGKLTRTDAWKELLDKYIPDELLKDKTLEGLEATRTISAQVIIKSDDPTVKNQKAHSRDVDFIDVPDFAVRHKYLETALKLRERYPKDEEKLPTQNLTQINYYSFQEPQKEQFNQSFDEWFEEKYGHKDKKDLTSL